MHPAGVGLDEELFEAVIDGNTARVRELLRKGANVNARDENGKTPLHARGCEGVCRCR
jgi:ankyrin repeat protein